MAKDGGHILKKKPWCKYKQLILPRRRYHHLQLISKGNLWKSKFLRRSEFNLIGIFIIEKVERLTNVNVLLRLL